MDNNTAFTPKRTPTDHQHPTQIRILCPSNKTGAVIGKGGSTVRHIQTITSAKIRLLDLDPYLLHLHLPTDERVIVITQQQQLNQNPNSNESDRNEEEEGEGLGPVQRAVVRVFEKIVKGDSEEEVSEGIVVTCRVLIGRGESGGGKVVMERILRLDTGGALVRVLPREQLPPCASPGDDLVMITGSFSAVKKALLSISSCLQDNTRAEVANSGVTKSSGIGPHGTAMPAPLDLPQRGYPPGFHATDYYSRGYSPSVGPENIGARNRKIIEEEVVFKLLCQHDKVGNLIGKGGSVIRAMQNDTGASIKIADAVPDSDGRVIVISARENLEQRHSPAQDAVIRVQSRIAEMGFERGTAVVARLLVHSQLIGCLLGKGGHIIAEMRQITGAGICIFPKEQAAKYGFPNDEVVQVTGNLNSVQDALFHITSRLREKIFPIKPPFSSNAAPPYPPPFPEMHPPHFRPRINPASPGPFPSPAGSFHASDRSGVHSHPLDRLPSFSHGVDRFNHPNLDRGPYAYGGERPGHGLPFEISPRSWTPQPFSNGNPRGGADVGSGLAARNGPQGSSVSQAPNLPSMPVEIVIPQKFLSHVYGENNSNLSQIRQISGANVLVHDPKPGATEGVVVVSGTSDQMHAAQSLIHAFILCGQTS